ncbi:glycosyltransferase family 2 protein [Anaeromyxobacter sp. SG66]|uniref:glycosyltransferase family 2 protein n=1 Tax=Anaeromyxobacter sp. SG66 TaxID=2925410 RepID=UPI001F5775E0|nr:glycosyltransferase family 2 protein [Anaeromyxobacter sp. SG66]
MILLHALEWGLLVLGVYTFAVALCGFLPRRKSAAVEPLHRFVVVVPAHDEAAVIGDAVRALTQLDYPRRMFRVVVVADNCSDDTAARARTAGADEVLERDEPGSTGKGHALRWALERVASRWTPDAICVFDADNVMSPNFLTVMNARLAAGAHVVQGYLDTKNPDDSWVTKAISTGYSVSSRLFQLSRENLGMSAALGGTGYCIRTSTLHAFPPDPACVTDDAELQMRLLREGIRVEWAHDAVTFDEKPLTMRASNAQRTRWMQGRWDVARRHLLPLLARALRHGDQAALDGAIACVQPSRSAVAVLAAGVAAVHAVAALRGSALAAAFSVPLPAWGALLACYAVFPMAAMRAEGMPARAFVRYAYTAIFNSTWLPILVRGLLRIGKRDWVSTQHTRSIPLEARLAERRPAPGGKPPGSERVA